MNSNDIAKLAGVSRSTVSRVINNYSNVPEETRKRVLEVVKEYNYVPHASARMLAGIKNKTIGLFMIDMREDYKGKQVSMSSYFTPFTSAIIDNANKKGYNILVSMVSNENDFKRVKETFYNKTISGGIFIGVRDNEFAIKEIIKEGYKVAIIDQAEKSDEGIYSKSIIVNADNFNGAYRATQYLIDIGHMSIAHITGEENQLSSIERLSGYKKALSDNKININEKLIIKGKFTVDSGYNATKKLLSKEKPTAIFLSNDSMAIGAIQAIQENGLKIPKDISIIGFDDIEIAKYLKPPLTTIRLDIPEMAALAVNALILSIENNSNFSANYIVAVKLIERESCKAINKE